MIAFVSWLCLGVIVLVVLVKNAQADAREAREQREEREAWRRFRLESLRAQARWLEAASLGRSSRSIPGGRA